MLVESYTVQDVLQTVPSDWEMGMNNYASCLKHSIHVVA